MTKMKRSLIGALAAASLVAMPLAAQADDPQDDVTLDLYNLTDVHGHIEKVTDRKDKNKIKEAGLPAVSCYLNMKREKNPNSSFTLLGDNIGASPYLTGSLDDNPTIEALNLLNPLGSTIGNHEFDLGVNVFKNRVKGANGYTKIGFPYLGANVHGLEDEYLGDYVIWESPSGVKVAFIGAIAEDVPYKLSPNALKLEDGSSVTFSDPIAKIGELSKSLKDSGQADLVIAMLDDDVKNNLPKMPDTVDGLMGGDTHVPYAFSRDPGGKNPGHKISATASGSYTDNLAYLQLTYNKTTKKLVKSTADLVDATTIAKACDGKEDPAVQAVVDKAKAASEEAGKKVVATNMQPFYRGAFQAPDADKPKTGANRGIESSLGDLVADAMRDQIKDEAGKSVDIGLINAGGLRDDLIPNDKREITYKDTFAVMPFSNQLGYVTITGADFKKALEDQWKTNLNSQNSRPMLKLGISSNVTYTYDPTRPHGDRITSVLINGEKLDPTKEYTVGSVTFLLAGGDTFPSLTNGGPAKLTHDLDREPFNDYLRNNKNLAPRPVKSSVGVTLPSGKITAGEDATIKLRGLSFSEGPSRPDKVTVTVGDSTASAEVNNDLTEPNANSEDSIITTDGAGQAEVTVTTDTAWCKGLPTPGSLTLPIKVSTDAGTLVPTNANLTISVACTAEMIGTPDDASTDPAQTDKPSNTPAPTKTSAANKTGNLAKTGADVTTLLLASLLMLVLGGGLVTATRYRMR